MRLTQNLPWPLPPMDLILDGNSEIGAHVLYLLFEFFKGILLDQEQSQIGFLFLRKDLFSIMRAHHILSFHLI